MITIHIRNHMNSLYFSLAFRPTDTIFTVKKKLLQQKRFKADNQNDFTLIWSGQVVKDQRTLEQYGIGDKNTFLICNKVRGGGCAPINFNDFNQQLIRNFSSQAPNWRTIGKGLNLEGVCKNRDCDANSQKVWIKKGFGVFHMSEQIYIAQCPICNKECEDVKNMGIYMAECNTRGRIKGQSNEKSMKHVHNNQNNLLTFEDKDETVVEWLYLILQVSPL